MKIGFLISGIGIFGSVREVVENCNSMTRMGHECFLFNPEGERVTWLECNAKVLFESKLNDYDLDLLILCAQINTHYYNLFENAKAKKKVYCFMGFNPEMDIFFGNKYLKHIADNYYLTADGRWQLEYLKQHTDSDRIIDATLGGVNMNMFRPLPQDERTELIIGWSGDIRHRKGGADLSNYFKSKEIRPKTYFNKGIHQDQMSEWFAGIDIFVDNHIWGGWCNPVAEAQACGVPVICSDIPCTEFVIHDKTGLKFKQNDFKTLDKHLETMKNDMDRISFAINGLAEIRKYSYDTIAEKFLKALDEN